MRTINKFLSKIRIRLKDTSKSSFSDYELLEYFNDAIHFLSCELIAQRDEGMLREKNFKKGELQCTEQEKLYFAGEFPVYINNGVINFHLNETENIKITYWAKYDELNLDSQIPFPAYYDLYIIQLTCIYALSRDNGGVPADGNIVERIRQNIITIRQGLQSATSQNTTKITS